MPGSEIRFPLQQEGRIRKVLPSFRVFLHAANSLPSASATSKHSAKERDKKNKRRDCAVQTRPAHNVRHVIRAKAQKQTFLSRDSPYLSQFYQISIPRLYLIEILHQTTTNFFLSILVFGCILLNFYIKPQRVVKAQLTEKCCILLNFYIKPQPSLLAMTSLICCILLKFYIKPQHQACIAGNAKRCILLKFYIKPQLWGTLFVLLVSCILLKFYIKPQLCGIFFSSYFLLYLIEILHQTTTYNVRRIDR